MMILGASTGWLGGWLCGTRPLLVLLARERLWNNDNHVNLGFIH